MSLQQREKLKALLLSRRGEWITAAEIAATAGLQYGARLYELRHEENLQIESRTERVRERGHSVVKRSWFRLMTDRQIAAAKIGQGQTPTKAEMDAALKDDSDQPSLFSEPLAERHRDDG
jgi:hypothetical protein